MQFNEIVEFLESVIKYRLDPEFSQSDDAQKPYDFSMDDSELSRFVLNHEIKGPELIILFLALVPHLSPGFYSRIIEKYLPGGGEFPEFGGVKGKNYRGILPTGETALFILAGDQVEKRLAVAEIFSESHLFAKMGVLFLEEVPVGEPKMSGRIILDDEYVDLFTTGQISSPRLSSNFPAQLITTQFEWGDLVLQDKTIVEIREIETWLSHNEELMERWEMQGKIKPGYRVLFYGQPGTGKTMTACLLGKYTNRDVFRIDLSMVISKYIGETEKNLSKLFDKAANKDWILFFDEADSIFGKRTDVRDAHDKYANQEVSYLLQRIESHPGLVILASNMKANIDPAFTRRFNSIIKFELPGANERLRLWQNYVPKSIQISKDVSFEEFAHKYEITGANILNVIHFACLQTLKNNSEIFSLEDLVAGIRKEYLKEGKMIIK